MGVLEKIPIPRLVSLFTEVLLSPGSVMLVPTDLFEFYIRVKSCRHGS